MSSQDLPKPDYVKNMKLVGYSDQGGRPDGVQVMVNKNHAIIGHMFSDGFSIINCNNPRKPEQVAYISSPPNTWNIHLQSYDDLLLVINAKNMFAAKEFQNEEEYYKGKLGEKVGMTDPKSLTRNWTAGIDVYDISNPSNPKKIGFMNVEGGGVHRIWYVGGQWAYASALLDGFTDYIFIIIDMSDPTKPKEVGRFWLPGMNVAAGETMSQNQARAGLHHPIINGDTAYLAWRDAGLVIMDIKDKNNPDLIVHRNWSPPFGGGTHNALPLPNRDLLVVLDEAVLDNCADGIKHIWIFDIRVPSNPISIATLPIPEDFDYKNKGAHFGPHNIHENRPDGMISENLIFATQQNAGVRVYDISNEYQPKEVAAFVPPKPKKLMDRRPNRKNIIQSADIWVSKEGLAYVSDYNAGLYILEYEGN